MRQITLAAAVFCLGGLCFCMAGDEPKKSSPSDAVARKLADLRKKFDTEEKEIKKKLADAQDPDDVKQATFQLKELSAITASDAVELFTDHPKSESAVDAAVFALKLLGQFRVTGGDMDKASAFVLDNHVSNPKIQAALAPMSQAGPAGMTFLKTVAEKSMSKEVQGIALFYVAVALDEEIAALEGQGNDMAAGRIRTEAIEKIEQAVKLAPDAKIGDETISKAAAREIASLKIGVGNLAPDVEGIDLDGKKVKLSSFQGKVTLLDFWATWCGPCVAMIPHEREMFEKLAKKQFVILGVNVDDKKETLKEFMDNEKMPWAHWWEGPEGPLAKTFKVRGYPTLYLIDAKGVIRKKWLGSPGNKVLDKAVEELVGDVAEKK